MVTPHKTKVHEQSPELRWLGSRPAELKAYDKQWVAIRGQKVVASADDVSALIAQLPEPDPDKGHPLVTRITRSDWDPNTYTA